MLCLSAGVIRFISSTSDIIVSFSHSLFLIGHVFGYTGVLLSYWLCGFNYSLRYSKFNSCIVTERKEKTQKTEIQYNTIKNVKLQIFANFFSHY